jgi:hypothetical protein
MDATVYFLEPDAWSDAWPDNDVTALDLVGGRVLNVGAGAGRFLLALQSRGHEPMALDVSPGAVVGAWAGQSSGPSRNLQTPTPCL